MRCAKCRHNAQKRTSGCRASGRHISIPIHRISFVDTQERVRIRRFTLTMYAQKNSRTNGGETFRRRMNFSKNRNLTATRAFRFPLFAQRFQRAQDKASNKTARFLKKCGNASEKRQKRFLFATLSLPLRLRWGKPTSFTPFCRRLGISEAKFGENSAKNKKKSRVEAVKRAELRFPRNPTVHSGGTPFRKQKKCRQNAAASENRVCGSFVRPFAPLSASRPRDPMRIALCLLRHRMSSDTVYADELLIHP